MENIAFFLLGMLLSLALVAAMAWCEGHRSLPGQRRMLGGATPRQLVAVLTLSAAGLVGIVAREGYSERAYPDPVHGPRVPTIGFGTTGSDVKMGQTTTPVKSLERAVRDVRAFEGSLKQCVFVPLHQHEYDAYVSLVYNVGAANFCLNNDRNGPSVIARRLAAQDYEGACDAILLYDRAGLVNKPSDRCSHPDNRTCRGLWSDRLKLHKQCLGAGAAH